MKELLKRLGSLALAVLMVVSLLPANALQTFAADEDCAAMIGTTKYATLAAAAAAAKNQNVITLMADSTGETLNIKNNSTLKLNGFTVTDATINVTSGKYLTISGAGGLTGTTTVNGTISIANAAEDLVINSGTTTVKTGASVANVTVQGTGVLKDDYALVSGTITATARVNNSNKKLWGYYGDVDTAVAATTTNYTMILLKDVVLTAPISFTKKVNLDLNGHNLSVSGDCTTAIVNSKGLTITDSTSDTDVIQGRIIAPVAVENTSSLTLTGGIVVDGEIKNLAGGTLTVKTCQLNGAINTAAVVKDTSGVIQNYYGDLQAAINAASKNYSVVMLRDTVLTDVVTIDSAKSLTLNLNGFTISQTKEQTSAYSMIENYGTLTITDSVGTGKISYTDSGNGGEYVSNTITNSGTLTVKGGTIENASAAIIGRNGYPYAIDNNSTTANAKLTIQGGTLVSNAYCSIRQLCNSTTYTNTLSITGGTLNGGIEFQNPNTAANLGSLKISGGTINGGSVAALYAFGAAGSDWSGMSASITGGNFTGNVTVTANANLTKFITGGVYTTDVSAYCADGLGATLDANGKYVVAVSNGVAQIGDVQYMSLEEALNAVKEGETIVLLENITIECDGIWDSRFTAVDFPITFDGNNKTVKIVGKVGDKNGNYVLRFNENSTVKNLTLDLKDTTGMLSGIAAKKGITLENCHLIGTGAAKTRGIQYGASAGSNVADLEIVVTNCTFTDWAFGVSDNQSGYDAKSVTITGSTFDNASVLISAWDTLTFTGNTLKEGTYARIESYTGRKDAPCLSVVAWGNTMQRHADGWITNVVSYEQIQWEFYCYAPAGVIVESGYGYYYDNLARAFRAAEDGQTVRVLQSNVMNESVENTKKVTLDLNGKLILHESYLFTNTSELTIIGAGTLDAEIRLTAVDAIVVAEERFNVTSGVDGYVVVYENGIYRLVGLVASVTDTEGNVEYFTTLEAALKAVKEDGSIVTLLKDITITGPWDSRLAAVNYSITLDGNDKTLTFVGTVNDLNGEYLLRLNKNSAIKDLTLDASQTVGMLSGVAAMQGITVDNSTFIGNGEPLTRAIQYGASAGANIANVEVTVTDSTFTNWAYGVSDNQSGADAKSVTITGSTFNNASAMLSAYESITFTENTIASGSSARIHSYRSGATVVAWDNTMEHHSSSKVTGANSYEQVQWEFITPAPAAVIVESGYGYYYDTLDRAFNAVLEGQAVRVLQNTELAASVANTQKITLELNGKVVNENAYLITNSSQLTIVGEGDFATEIQLTAVDAIVVAEERFNVTSGVDGYVVVYENGAYRLLDAVASVTDAEGNVEYFTSLQAAIDAAEDGELVTLLKDITESQIITINKSITLDGGEHTITSSAGRAINIDSANGAIDVQIQDLTIVGENGCQRGINIIDSVHSVTTTPATVTLTNVDISGVSHYAVHVATTAGAADVTIEDSQLSGWAAVAVYGAGTTVTVEDSDLIGTNDYTGETNSFSTIAVGAKNVEITVTGGSITATANTEQPQFIVGANKNSSNGSQILLDTELNFNAASGIVGLSIDGITVTLRDDYIAQVNDEGYAYIDNGDGTITLVLPVATVTDAEGKVTPYATLQGAIDAAEAGELVTLLKDVTESQAIVINKPITLDGNDKTLNSTATRAINVECAGQVTIQDLTVTGTANTERAINVIKQPATLTLENVTAEDFKYTVNVAASSVGSNITINGGKFSGYAALNVTGDNTVVTVNDAELIGNNNAAVHESNAFAAISVGDITSGQTTDNVKIMVNGGTITATSVNGNDQFIVAGAAVTDATVVIDAQLNLYNGLVFNGDPDDFRLAAFRNEYGDELNDQGYMHEPYTDTLIKLGGYAVAYNVQTNVYYNDLLRAVTEASIGDTVRILRDLEDNRILNILGILDLNGYTLTANNYVMAVLGGSGIIDSSEEKTGLLKIDLTKLRMLDTKPALPIAVEGGYKFVNVTLYQMYSTKNSRLQFWFTDVDQLLIDEGTSNALEDVMIRFEVLLTWDGGSQRFILRDADAVTYLNNWEKGTLYLKVTNPEIVTNLQYTARVVFAAETTAEVIMDTGVKTPHPAG